MASLKQKHKHGKPTPKNRRIATSCFQDRKAQVWLSTWVGPTAPTPPSSSPATWAAAGVPRGVPRGGPRGGPRGSPPRRGRRSRGSRGSRRGSTPRRCRSLQPSRLAGAGVWEGNPCCFGRVEAREKNNEDRKSGVGDPEKRRHPYAKTRRFLSSPEKPT